MAARTIENCTLIQKNTKSGVEEPMRWYFLDKCEGYKQPNNDEELFGQCKKCRYCVGN